MRTLAIQEFFDSQIPDSQHFTKIDQNLKLILWIINYSKVVAIQVPLDGLVIPLSNDIHLEAVGGGEVGPGG